MRITTRRTETSCDMFFWVGHTNFRDILIPIIFTKKAGDEKYSLSDCRDDRKLEEIIEALQNYIPNIEKSATIDEDLEIMLRLKYETE